MKPGHEYSPHKKFIGVFIPLGLMQSGLVSPGAMILFGRLAMYHGKNKSAWPKMATLSGELCTHERTVERWMAELVSAGFIRRSKRGQGKSADCSFLWHKALESCLRGTRVNPTDLSDQTDIPDAVKTTKMPDQKLEPSINPTDLSDLDPTNLSDLDPTDLSGPYKEEKTQGKDSIEKTHPPPQGSAATPADDDEEFPFLDSQNQNLNAKTVTVIVHHSAEDLEALSGYLRKFLNDAKATLERYIDGDVPPPRPEFVLTVTKQAPAWNAAQIAYALQQNSFERPCKPKTYRWFVQVVAGIYAERNGIPPEVPAEQPCRDRYTPYDEWIRQQPPDVKPEPNCSRCDDTGRIHNEACSQCEIGAKLKADHEASRIYQHQCDRWQVLYNQHRAAHTFGKSLDFSNAGKAFFCGTPDMREAVLVQLEAGVDADKVEIPEFVLAA